MAFINVGRGLAKNGNPGRPNAKNPYIVLFKADDLKTNPVKNVDGVSVSVNIELKVGKEAIVIYATPTTIKLGDKSSGDADKKGFITTLEFEHPGSGIEYAEFVNSNVNESLMAIVMYPDLGFNKLIGWPGNSLQMSHEYKDDEKEDTNMVKLVFFQAINTSITQGCSPLCRVEQKGWDSRILVYRTWLQSRVNLY